MTLDDKTIYEMAEVWREKNPVAWEYLVDSALKCRMVRNHYSIKALTNELRFSSIPVEYKIDGFKLNTTLESTLARMLMDEYPDLKGFFETRRAKVDSLRKSA